MARNVALGDRLLGLATRTGMAAPSSRRTQVGRPDIICHMNITMVSLGKNGRMVIPAPFRRALGIEAGDELVVTLDDGELRIATRDHAVTRAQDVVRRHVAAGTSLVDELIEERRSEAGS